MIPVNTNIANDNLEISKTRNKLNGALLATEMAKQYPEKWENLKKPYTDSATVLNYLTNLDLPLKEYGKFRFPKNIKSYQSWKWQLISRQINPADYLMKLPSNIDN